MTNSALYNCLHILKHKYSQKPSLAGFGSFGIDELYLKLKRYKRKMSAFSLPLSSSSTSSSSSFSTTSFSSSSSSSSSSFLLYDNESENRLKIPPNTDDNKVLHHPLLQTIPCTIPYTYNDIKTRTVHTYNTINDINDVYSRREQESTPKFVSISTTTLTPTITLPSTSTSTSSQKYYVVALDLEKCYDNVDTSLLYDLIYNLLCSDDDHSNINDNSNSNGNNDNHTSGAKRTNNLSGTSNKAIDKSKILNLHGIHKDDKVKEKEEKEKEEERDEDEDADGDEDEGYMVHRYSVSHYISRYELR